MFNWVSTFFGVTAAIVVAMALFAQSVPQPNVERITYPCIKHGGVRQYRPPSILDKNGYVICLDGHVSEVHE